MSLFLFSHPIANSFLFPLIMVPFPLVLIMVPFPLPPINIPFLFSLDKTTSRYPSSVPPALKHPRDGDPTILPGLSARNTLQ